jgi:hypothetical protein
MILPDVLAHLDTLTLLGADALLVSSPAGKPLRHTNFRRRVLLPALAASGLDVHLLSRPGARFRCCHRPVSPDRSPNPPYRSLGNGLSTVTGVRRGSQVARGMGSCSPGRRNGRPSRVDPELGPVRRDLPAPGGGGQVPAELSPVPAVPDRRLAPANSDRPSLSAALFLSPFAARPRRQSPGVTRARPGDAHTAFARGGWRGVLVPLTRHADLAAMCPRRGSGPAVVLAAAEFRRQAGAFCRHDLSQHE